VRVFRKAIESIANSDVQRPKRGYLSCFGLCFTARF
jgi:hypothetical protein